jgi:pyruvate dehydrogenase E2 component (dihydrolipoamide acetyltransferase)
MEQGTLAKWAKKVGDHVVEGDLIAEIETDKATMGLEAGEEGYLAKILVAEKTKDIPLKTLLCIMVVNKDDVAAFADYKPGDDVGSSGSPTAAAPAPTPAPASTPAPPPPPQAPPRPAPVAAAVAAPPAAQTSRAAGRVFASPLARRLAAERNIDLAQVGATGPDNQVRAQDILNYVSSTPSPAPRAQVATVSGGAPGDFEDQAINNYRAVTAKRLSQSKQTIPHYYLTVDLSIDNALKIRQDLNEQFAKSGEADGANLKLSINDFVIKAAALACRKVF